MSTSRPTMAELESRAIALIRQAAGGRPPLDPGVASQLANVVRDTYVAGKQNMLAVVTAACQMAEEANDPGVLTEILDGLKVAAG